MIKNKILKYLFLATICFISFIHIQRIIFVGVSLNQLTLIICMVIGVAVYRESRILYYYSFILFGIGAILTLGYNANVVSVGLFFAALTYRNKPKNLIEIYSILSCSFVLNFFIYSRTDFYNLPLLIIGNISLIQMLVFRTLRQTGSIIKLSRTTPLNKRQLLILRQLSKDIPRKQIPDSVKESELWSLDLEKKKFTLDIINTDIAKIKQKLEIKGDFALALWYKEKIEIIKEDNK